MDELEYYNMHCDKTRKFIDSLVEKYHPNNSLPRYVNSEMFKNDMRELLAEEIISNIYNEDLQRINDLPITICLSEEFLAPLMTTSFEFDEWLQEEIPIEVIEEFKKNIDKFVFNGKMIPRYPLGIFKFWEHQCSVTTNGQKEFAVLRFFQTYDRFGEQLLNDPRFLARHNGINKEGMMTQLEKLKEIKPDLYNAIRQGYPKLFV